MKLLLITLLTFTAPALALACKPAAVPNCKQADRVLLRAPTLKKLEAKVATFQQQLTAALNQAKENNDGDWGRSSCFNNQFAGYYIGGAKAYAAKHKKLFCPKYLDSIDASVKRLIDPQSEEWKALPAEAIAQLKPLAAEVQAALDEFQGAHSK